VDCEDVSVSVVIPVYNAEKTIDELVLRIQKIAYGYSNFEIILIDDFSQDKTWGKLLDLSKWAEVDLKIIRLSRNFGQHPATVAGIREATNEWIVILDCDLQDEPENIRPLLSQMRKQGTQIGHVLEENSKRRFTSRIFNLVTSKKYGIPNNVTTFRIISAEICNEALKYGDFSLLTGPIIDQMGFRRSFITANRVPRSSSTYTLRKRWRLAINYLISLSKLIPKLLAALSIVTIVPSVLYIFVILYHKLIGRGSLPSGLNQIVILNLVTIGIVTGLGSFLTFLLLELMGRIRNYPAYHIEEKITHSSK
jgi:glycosyltransferase involved in cell wall biosynthesis